MSAGSAAGGAVSAPFSPSLFFSAFAPLISIVSSSSDLRLVRTMDDISSVVEPPSGLDDDPLAQAVPRAWRLPRRLRPPVANGALLPIAVSPARRRQSRRRPRPGSQPGSAARPDPLSSRSTASRTSPQSNPEGGGSAGDARAAQV